MKEINSLLRGTHLLTRMFLPAKIEYLSRASRKSCNVRLASLSHHLVMTWVVTDGGGEGRRDEGREGEREDEGRGGWR